MVRAAWNDIQRQAHERSSVKAGTDLAICDRHEGAARQFDVVEAGPTTGDVPGDHVASIPGIGVTGRHTGQSAHRPAEDPASIPGCACAYVQRRRCRTEQDRAAEPCASSERPRPDVCSVERTQAVSLGDAVVSAIVPARRRPSPRTPGLPVARLTAPDRDESAHYAVTAMDAHGRLADRSSIRFLNWEPGQPITLTIMPDAVLVLPRPDGSAAITQQGHLRLPPAVRDAFGLKPGDRMLLAAFPDHGALVTYTIAALDAMIRTYHQSHPARTRP